MNRVSIALGALGVVLLACGTSAPRHLDLYPTVTTLPTQTPYIVVISATPISTMIPAIFPVQTTTLAPIPHCWKVSALESVYLRPAPNVQNYPIAPIPNGAVVAELGGKSGDWLFVALGDKQGWINQVYLKRC